MALPRPPAPICEGFAALGPQLQTLARAVDSDTPSTSTVLEALDGAACVAVNTTPLTNIPPDTTVGLAVPTAEFMRGGIVNNTGTSALALPATSRRYWYQIGAWIRTSNTRAIDEWRMEILIGDIDPLTGFNSYSTFTRGRNAPFPLSLDTPETIWLDCLAQSAGGSVHLLASHQAPANRDINLMRMWAWRVSAVD